MENDNKKKVIREILVNDAATGLCFWSLVLLVFMQLFSLPQSLATALTLFFITVIVLCLPVSLYRIGRALHLAGEGVGITASILSVDPSFFGRKVTFEYEYDGNTYQNTKYFLSIFFPEKDTLKLLIDAGKPWKFAILELKKKSIMAIVKEREPD